MNSAEQNILVLYHADCMDGYAAAWALWKTFSNQARYKAVRHNTKMPVFTAGTLIYIVDFCYPIEQLISAAESASKIIVLDHHISAQKQVEAYQKHACLPENLEFHFNQQHSGCMLAWQYFHPHTPAPQLLQYIEDHDLWHHQLAESQEISKALYLRLPVHFAAFEKLKLPTLKREGALLQKQQQLNIRRLLKARHAVKIMQYSGLAVNAPAMFSSDLGHELAKKSTTFGLTYFYHGSRQCYECSIRSVADFDVSLIAQQFAGGGHKNAAGFSVDVATFMSFVTAEKLAK